MMQIPDCFIFKKNATLGAVPLSVDMLPALLQMAKAQFSIK